MQAVIGEEIIFAAFSRDALLALALRDWQVVALQLLTAISTPDEQLSLPSRVHG